MTVIDSMRTADVRDVARQLGLTVTPPRGASGGAIGPCPLCGIERRHRKTADRRLAVGARKDGLGARCYECGAGFDALGLVVAVEGGARAWRDLTDDGRGRVLAWCERYTGCDPATRVHASVRLVEAAPAPSYPPLAEVLAVLDASVRVDADDPTADYLISRGLDPTDVADRQLARALPPDADVPEWARGWPKSGHRLIVTLFDSSAHLRSLIARAVVPAERKSLAPRGYQRAGLVMADALGLHLLARGVLPPWWTDGVRLRVVICEGEIDHLVWGTYASDADETAPATFGIVSGAWQRDHADRVPDGSTVLIATDRDAAGDKLAAAVVETFRQRAVELLRWEP